MLQGAYRAAVASCRESLELLTNLHEKASAGDELSKGAVLKTFADKETRSNMSRAQRIVFLRIAANHLTHLAHHPPESLKDVLSRQDAALAIASCAGLISASMTEGLGQRSGASD